MKLTKEELDALIDKKARELLDSGAYTAHDKAVKEIEDSLREKATSTMAKILDGRRDETPHEKGTGFARLARAVAHGRTDGDKVKHFLKKHYDDPLNDRMQKTLLADNFTAGGVLVPEGESSEVIELLRSRSVVRRAGPITVPMPNGNLGIPKITGGSTSAYEGEAAASNASDVTFGSLKLTWKKLKTKVPISNELLSFSSQAVDALVRDDMIMGMAEREDIAFLRGLGTDATPKGLLNWAIAGNKFNSAGVTLANVRTDVSNALQKLVNNKVRMLRPAWFMSHRSFIFLKTQVVDANDNLPFETDLSAAQPMFYGYPVYWTQNLPNNLGGGSNESEIYLVDMADAVLGEALTMTMKVSDEATFTDSTGTLISAFDRDLTIMSLTTHHDFGMRHEESIAVIQAVTYGA